MADIRFSSNTYPWENFLPTNASQPAIDLAKTPYEKAKDAIAFFMAPQEANDSVIRVFVAETSPLSPAHGDLWTSTSANQRWSAPFGDSTRTNLFSGHLNLASYYVQAGNSELFEDFLLDNRPSVRFTATTTSIEFRAGIEFTAPTSGTFTISFMVSSTLKSGIRSLRMGTPDSVVDEYVLPTADTPQRISITRSLASGSSYQFFVTPGSGEDIQAGDVLFIGAPMVELASVVGSYFDGNSESAVWDTVVGGTATYTPQWVDDTTGHLNNLKAVLTEPDYVDGFVDVFRGPEPPLPASGDLWVVGTSLRRWDGSVWVEMVDSIPAIQDEIENLRQTISLGGGALTTSGVSPTLADGADKPLNAMWYVFDINDNIIESWRWNGSAWVELSLVPGNNFLPYIDIATGTIGNLTAGRLEAGSINVPLDVAAGGSITLGVSTGVNVQMVSNEIAIYSPETENPNGANTPGQKMIVMGGATGGSFETFSPTTGEVYGGVRADGSYHGPRVDSNEYYLSGEPLSTAIAASGAHQIVRGYLSTSHSEYTGEYVAVAGMNSPEPMLASRDYVFRAQFRARANTASYGNCRLYYTTNGTTPNPATSSFIGGSKIWMQAGSSILSTYQFDFNISPDVDWPKPRFSLCLGTPSGTATSQWYYLWLNDVGPAAPSAAIDRYLPPPETSFTRTYTATQKTTYTQFGLNTSYSPSLVRTGLGGSSVYRSFITIPSAALSDIRNSIAVPTVQIWLQYATDGYDIEPWTGTATNNADGTISNPSQRPFSISGTSRTGLRPGEGGWITLHSTQRDAIRNSSTVNYYVIGRTTSSPLVSYYGVNASNTAHRPKFRITGTE
jgi:hypothetical protein